MTTTYRDAATILWGDAGAYAHDAYARLRGELYPGLPESLPIVIGITAYGHCIGLTRSDWTSGPRITLFSSAFARGRRYVDDILIHEMLHVQLALDGHRTKHDGDDWYASLRRLSPAVLGRALNVRRGAGRRSVRVPNPAWTPGGGVPKTLVRKEQVKGSVPHGDVARWPHAFRPRGYGAGDSPIECPSY